MPRASKAILPPPDVRRVAVAASVDPRTVVSYLAGRRVLPSVADLIESALRACGYSRLVRDGASTGSTAA